MYFIADRHTSIAEGSMGLIQSRFLVDEDFADEAKNILINAGLSDELYNG